MNRIEWQIGIDEAGRGPLAGPVAVGLVKVPADFDWILLPGVGDSKKISTKNRAEIFRVATKLKQEGKLDFVVILGEVKAIDSKGIAVVIRECIEDGLKQLKLLPDECHVKLDGALKAPGEFSQETIIKGDSKELVIGLASILAKETRDVMMVTLAQQYANYSFEKHKGYGTKLHRNLIFTNGLSPIHRVTYCKNHATWGTV